MLVRHKDPKQSLKIVIATFEKRRNKLNKKIDN